MIRIALDGQPVTVALSESVPDQLKKFRDLLDSGAILNAALLISQTARP